MWKQLEELTGYSKAEIQEAQSMLREHYAGYYVVPELLLDNARQIMATVSQAITQLTNGRL
jgi:hypothetical protein